ncbi:hypothetical protein ILUMI_11828 [Ignelater luminosus]|uniref:14 kDa phosphohistidine phosphatase n=1 Tax=Ignelater luminosus TaxID=2038154 RepID=A0A8K0CVD6_IGNLU|nr:hypothetical protein ILUMI_11828 [Ignelater luminosus]
MLNGPPCIFRRAQPWYFLLTTTDAMLLRNGILNLNYSMIRSFNCLRGLITMSTSGLMKVPEVDIDATGVFKYILIKLTSPGEKGTDRLLVRGYGICNFHSDINDMVTKELQKMKEKGDLPEWSTKVLGGGRIIHDAPNKTIKVYGYSQGYGKADHAKTVDLLKKVYEDYDISWSDEGY